MAILLQLVPHLRAIAMSHFVLYTVSHSMKTAPGTQSRSKAQKSGQAICEHIKLALWAHAPHWKFLRICLFEIEIESNNYQIKMLLKHTLLKCCIDCSIRVKL